MNLFNAAKVHFFQMQEDYEFLDFSSKICGNRVNLHLFIGNVERITTILFSIR